jgi:hypothetical protein
MRAQMMLWPHNKRLHQVSLSDQLRLLWENTMTGMSCSLKGDARPAPCTVAITIESFCQSDQCCNGGCNAQNEEPYQERL